MKLINKLFGGIKMSWPVVILFSLFIGLFCGVFGGLPALENTSFTDMAGGYEWWVLTAVIITVNCKRFWEAGLKCGVYFLITQPAQFFVQALLYSHNYSNALAYTRMWMPVIIATFIGGAIAYCAKKENVIGAIILGIGDAMEGLSLVYYIGRLTAEAPRHLLAAILSFVSVIIMTLGVQHKKKYRIIAIITAVVITAAVYIYCRVNGLQI